MDEPSEPRVCKDSKATVSQLLCDFVLVCVWMYEVLCLLVYYQWRFGIGDSGFGGCGWLVSGLGGSFLLWALDLGFFPVLCNPQAVSPAVRRQNFWARTSAKLHSRCCGQSSMDKEIRKDREQHWSQCEWLDGCPRISS